MAQWELDLDVKTGKELIMRYEELRARALGQGDRSEEGLGWALFVRKGMVEWLRAWQDHGLRHAAEHNDVGESRIVAASEQQNDIVSVWTAMVLGHLPGRMICT